MSRRSEGMWAAVVGSPVCPECGGEPAEQRRPAVWERFRSWMIHGISAPVTAVCANGHEWSDGGRVHMYRVRTGPRWLRVSFEMFRAVRSHRSLMPVPLTYVIAAGVGVAVGVAADLVLGWRWWLAAAGFVAVIWLVFFTSGLWRSPRELIDELGMVIDPHRFEAETFARVEAAVTDGLLVCYTVDAWDGTRALSGWGGATEVREVTLNHGSPPYDAAWISVTTNTNPHPGPHSEEEKRIRITRDLVSQQDQPPPGLQPEELARWGYEHRQRIAQADLPPWRKGSLPVDGEAINCEEVHVADSWAVRARHRNAVIDITGVGAQRQGLALSRVTDLTPYIEGTIALRERYQRG